MPLRPTISTLLLLALAACGGPEKDGASETRTIVQLPLDSAPPASVPASAPLQQPASPQPAAASKDEGGALRLDEWHRRTAEARRVPGGAAAAELSELHQALGGQAAAVQARWRQRAPAALGAEAQRLAEAFASGGTAALEAALAAAPMGDPARLAFAELLCVRALELQETARAGAALGTLLADACAVGYPRERILEWGTLAAGVADGVGQALPATEYTVASGDSYWKICRDLRKQGRALEPGWIQLFNRRRGDNIRAGEKLMIPSAPLRVECWRQLRLTAVLAGDWPIRLYASSSGKPETQTPLGDFTLKICEPQPIYYPPEAPSVPYGNPENPLGERWLGFAEDRQYGLHGTNSESTIGSFETGGCIRLHNADVIELFDLVGPATRVRINP